MISENREEFFYLSSQKEKRREVVGGWGKRRFEVSKATPKLPTKDDTYSPNKHTGLKKMQNKIVSTLNCSHRTSRQLLKVHTAGTNENIASAVEAIILLTHLSYYYAARLF